jgi:hypothetical protein
MDDDPVAALKDMAVKAGAVQEALDKQIALLRNQPPRRRMTKLEDYGPVTLSERAGTETEKGDILARIWAAWQDGAPDMRLGQFLYNAINAEANFGKDGNKITTNIFYIEDYTLADIAEKYAGLRKGEEK